MLLALESSQSTGDVIHSKQRKHRLDSMLLKFVKGIQQMQKNWRDDDGTVPSHTRPKYPDLLRGTTPFCQQRAGILALGVASPEMRVNRSETIAI